MLRHITSCLLTLTVLFFLASCSNDNNKSGTESVDIDPVNFTDEGLPGAIYHISGADISADDEQLSLKQVGGRKLTFENSENNLWQARIPSDYWGESLAFELLDGTGTVLANYIVETAERPTLTNFSGGYNHSCVIADGQPICWGANKVEQYSVLSANSHPVAISALNNLTCAQNDNDEVECSGILAQYINLSFEQPQFIESSSYQHITDLNTLVSGSHFLSKDFRSGGGIGSLGTFTTSSDIFQTQFLCAIEQRMLNCNGQSKFISKITYSGGFGGPDKILHDEVFEWSTFNGFVGTDISATAAGGNALCMIADNEVACKGLGSTPLPSADFGGGLISLPLAGLSRAEFESPTLLAMAGNNACVVDQNGTHCWDIHSAENLPIPAQLATPSDISLGYQHFCTIVEGKANCWGDYCISDIFLDVIGVSAFENICFDDEDTIPANSQSEMLELISGEAYSCSLNAAGEIQCWGKYCELPNGSFSFGFNRTACKPASSLAPKKNYLGARLDEISDQEISGELALSIAAYGLSDPSYSAQSDSPEIVNVLIDATTGELTLNAGDLNGSAIITVTALSGRLSLEHAFTVNASAAP